MDEQELQRLFEKFQSGVKLTDDEMQKLAKDASLANRALSNMGSALGSLTKHAINLGKKLYDGEQGASAYNDAIKSGTDAFGDLLGSLGPLGKVLGFLVKAFGGYVQEVNKMSDRLYKSYQNLSKVGVTAADGMMGLAESAQRLGLGLSEAGIENFGRLMKASAQDLALLSGSAVQGRKDFTDFASEVVRGSAGRELMNLGYSVEELNEGLASYIGLQARAGTAQNKTQAELRAGAAAYLKEMDALTKLTGLQKAELEEGINKARAVEAFRAKVEDLRAQGREKEADEMEKYFAVLQKQAPTIAQGFAEAASGLIVSDAGRQYNLAIDQGTGIVEKLSTGAINATQALQGTYQQSKLSEEQFRSLAMAMGSSNVVGSYTELADLAKRAGVDMETAAQFVKEQQDAQAQGPGGVAAQTDMRRAQMESRDALQNMVKAGVGPATSAMAGLAKVTNSVVSGLGGKVAGGYSGGGGGGGAATSGGLSGVKDAAGGGGVGFFRALGMGMQGLGLGATGPTSEPVSGVEGKLLNFIGKIEGRGDYNILVGGKSLPELTEMTVGQVLDYQSGMRSRGHESTAVGKYQIIQGTLQGLLKRGVVGPDDKFNASTQDKLATALMQGRGLDQYKAGKIPADAFADSLAKEWASLPTASGRSYYAGTGSNKSLVGRDEFMSVFARDGGVFAGPKSGYAATLHGTEAVIPLPDGKTIPVVMPELASNLKDQMGMMGAQLMALENLVSIMRDQTSISTKILQAANN